MEYKVEWEGGETTWEVPQTHQQRKMWEEKERKRRRRSLLMIHDPSPCSQRITLAMAIPSMKPSQRSSIAKPSALRGVRRYKFDQLYKWEEQCGIE